MIKICGIIGTYIANARHIRATLNTIFRNQKERGTKGAGLTLYRPAEDLIWRIRGKNPKAIIKHKLLDEAQKGDLLLFHHRLPTSTPNIKKCNHPIASEDNRIHLIHNGWITSTAYHFKRLKQQGHRFETEVQYSSTSKLSHSYFSTGEIQDITDSELIVHELEENLRNKSPPEAIESVADRLYGAVTYACTIRPNPCIYIYRGSQPCKVYEDNQSNVWFSSLYPSKIKRFRKLSTLEEGDIASISAEGFKLIKKSDPFVRIESIANSAKDSRDIGEIIEWVIDSITHSAYAYNRYISFDNVVEALSDELELSGIRLSKPEFASVAYLIWESL